MSPRAATPRKHRNLWQHSPLRRARNPLAKASLALLLASSGTACRASIDAFGADAARARYAAETLFAGFAYRFYEVTRDSAFEHARKVMGEYALIPSRLYRDSTIWNDRGRRQLTDAGRRRDVHRTTDYVFTANPRTRRPAKRSATNATRSRSSGSAVATTNGSPRWTMPSAPPNPRRSAAAIMATLTAAEGRSADEALADARSMFPQARRDTWRSCSASTRCGRVHEGGATTTTLSVRFRPELLRPRYPYFAAFVSKYIVPTIYSVQLTDHAGRQFFEAVGRDGQLIDQASLAATTGSFRSPARPSPMPDSLRLRWTFR